MKKIIAAIAVVISLPALYAQKTALETQIESAVSRIEPKCVAWRRDFHEHPELSNREFRTSKIIADHLRSLGIEVKEGDQQ